MGELELEQLQEKIDAGILLAQQRLKEKVLREFFYITIGQRLK